jgi:Integrase core domain
LIGHGYIHAAVDDHCRLAYAEIHLDERRETAAGFLARAHAWFADRGVVIQRVLTDNGSCYRSHRVARPLPPWASRSSPGFEQESVWPPSADQRLRATPP